MEGQNDPGKKPSTLWYDLLDPTDHIKIAAFNGDLPQLKVGLSRIDLDKLVFPSAIKMAAMNHHLDCVEYLITVSAEHEAKVEAERELELENAPAAHKKQCPSCGPVVTKYSNCPRCWGPVSKRQ
jgi:hypothetical protein